MEHEVFVPFPADMVRQALVDPARVARCVPGLQLDADEAAQSSDTLVGRLRLRIAGSTITYRGSLRVTEQDGGDLAVEGEGKEVRGGGSVKLAMIMRLTASEGGTILGCTGTVSSGGRLAESDDDAAAGAARRLLDRFAARLASGLQETPPVAGAAGAQPSSQERAGGPADADAAGPGAPEQPADDAAADAATEGTGDVAPEPAGDAEPGAGEPEAREPEAGAEPAEERVVGPETVNGSAAAEAVNGSAAANEAMDPDAEDAGDGPAAESGAGIPGSPPDGALARRTMIGRSAEEVDHSPPRGRYAPVPAPEPLAVGITLRWAAPAAAVAVASAVVISRLLRRRRP